MSISEGLSGGLRWSDLDLKAARLTVNQSLERVQGRTVFKAPKTRTSRRTITLPALTVEALAKHRLTQAEERLGLGLGKPELVLAHPDGSPLDPDSLSKAFDKLIRATGVRRITFHGLRHTHISHQLMDGVHVKVVSERAGHANVAITLGVYARSFPICRLMPLRELTSGFAKLSSRNSVASRWQSRISNQSGSR